MNLLLDWLDGCIQCLQGCVYACFFIFILESWQYRNPSCFLNILHFVIIRLDHNYAPCTHIFPKECIWTLVKSVLVNFLLQFLYSFVIVMRFGSYRVLIWLNSNHCSNNGSLACILNNLLCSTGTQSLTSLWDDHWQFNW